MSCRDSYWIKMRRWNKYRSSYNRSNNSWIGWYYKCKLIEVNWIITNLSSNNCTKLYNRKSY